MAPEIENDLNEEIEVEVEDATVITVPIDDTLTQSGEAADAKAVGDALALKADLSQVTGISVNGEAADAQGKILISGADIPVSGSDATKLNVKIAAMDGKTAADIPMSSEAGAQTIAQAIADGIDRNADAIPLTTGSEETVKDALDDLDTAVDAIQDWTAADIPFSTSAEDTSTVKDKLDTLLDGTVKTVNNTAADANGNIALNTVPYAKNLESELNHKNSGTFIQRTTGGDGSVDNGSAWLTDLKGNSVHTGYTAESIEMTVNGDNITATIDRDTFVGAVSQSGTTTLTYTSSWSADPATYGITVSGTPENGDTITVVYVKEVRGTITPADPQTFVSTGWNLYNSTTGYAKVVKYDYGYHISGAYTAVKYAAMVGGAQSAVTVNNGRFNVPADGYVFVTGGNGTTTAIWAEWEDWTDSYPGDFAAYAASAIDLSSVMSSYFPYGLLKAGAIYDEIDLDVGQAISRIERLAYSAANLAAAEASGREYEYDQNYIYLARATAVTNSITVSSEIVASDHGIEYFTGTTVDVNAELLYGNNLKNKLERDVLTISAQSLTAAQQGQARTNIGAASAEDLEALDSGMDWFSLLDKTQTTGSYVSKNLITGRKLSDYSMIGIMAYRGEWILGTQMLPMSWFLASSGVAILTKWSSTDIEIDVKPVSGSDTSVQVKHITTDTGTIYVRIFAYAKAKATT